MSHPFGDAISQFLHRKHGVNQSRLAAGIDQPHFVITLMCQGKRLTGPQARQRVLAIIEWMQQQQVLYGADEANRLLQAAGMADLDPARPREAAILAASTHRPAQLSPTTIVTKPEQLMPQGNLPFFMTSFIGRAQESEEIRQLLVSGGQRLVTLTGAGGTGKTRLAIEVAASLEGSFSDGVWLVELAGLDDPQQIAQVIVTTLGVHDVSAEKLIDLLRARQMLLLLDNCEHLIEGCSRLAQRILRYCPSVWIMATSREALNIEGEVPYGVMPLPLPPVQSARGEAGLDISRLNMQYDAVRLFVDRARVVQPRFTLTRENAGAVVQICRQVDGIPLAIELAAARLKVLAVGQIARRLNDRFRLLTGGSRDTLPRQQTLRALIDWSYDLLAEPERLLLHRLAIFAGGWSLEAAETICAGGPLKEEEILDLLTQLVHKSLVVMDEQDDEASYHMLGTIRQYALEKLSACGEMMALAEQHLAYYLKFIELDEPVRSGPEQTAWFERLSREQDNLRAAFAWAQTHDPDRAQRLSRSIWWFWYLREDNP